MSTTKRLSKICTRRAARFAILALVVLALTGCFEPETIVIVPATSTPHIPQPTETPPSTPTPIPPARDFPLAAPALVSVEQPAHQTCVDCHTDQAKLRESLSASEAAASESGGQAGAGGQPADSERWELVYLDNPEFLETMHGRYGCITCHGGTGDTLLVEVAHTGLVRRPSAADLCVDCHVEEVSTAESSPHASVSGYRDVLFTRSSADKIGALEAGIVNHCEPCHTATCGQCHVSRAATEGGELVTGHLFEDTQAVNLTCAGCHGSRIEAEYEGQGAVGQADVHWSEAEMVCTDCHLATDFHGTPEDESLHRYDGRPSPSCDASGCHPNVSEDDGIGQHADSHLKNLSCQACHSAAYQNCYGCHVTVEDEVFGSTLESTEIAFKIGRNPIQGRYRPWKYVPVRHVPVVRDSFSYYGSDLLPDFDALPTWKYATPHTIQRITPQNASCDACHGNAEIFLTAADVAPEELDANRRVIVEQLPEPVD